MIRLANSKTGYTPPVVQGPSKLPYIAKTSKKLKNWVRVARVAYGQNAVGWGASLLVAAYFFTDRSLSDFLPTTTAGFWSWLPGWQSGRVNSRN